MKPPLSASQARTTAAVAQEATLSHPKGASPITKPYKPIKQASLPTAARRSAIEDAPSVIGGRPYQVQK